MTIRRELIDELLKNYPYPLWSSLTDICQEANTKAAPPHMLYGAGLWKEMLS